MNALPYFLSSLFGWAVGHVSNLLDRHSHLLRLLNYPIGILGAALGTMLSQSLQNLQNKFLLIGIAGSVCALLLYRCMRRLLVREDFASNFERV